MFLQRPTTTHSNVKIQDDSPLKPKTYQLTSDHFDRNTNNVPSTHFYSSQSFHGNQLPVNLLHSSTQYNKMLITNGKSIKKNTQPKIEGYIENLQFINDQIFQSCQQKRESMRKRYNSSDKKKQGSSFTQECQCCCCDQFCSLCANETKFNKKKSIQIQNAPLDILQTQKKLQKSLKKRKVNKSKNKKKVITSKKQIQNMTQKLKSSDLQGSSSYLSHKSFNIDNLICNSLIKFQQDKRDRKIKDLQKKQSKQNYRKFMKMLQLDIRQLNRTNCSASKNKKTKSRSKSEVRMNYWKQNREKIAEELRRPSVIKKSTLKIAQSGVCDHKPKLNSQMIVYLQKKHEQQALQKIAAKTQEKLMKQKNKKQKLRNLEKQRKKHINSCPKKKFEPSDKMIEQAFVDINKQ